MDLCCSCYVYRSCFSIYLQVAASSAIWCTNVIFCLQELLQCKVFDMLPLSLCYLDLYICTSHCFTLVPTGLNILGSREFANVIFRILLCTVLFYSMLIPKGVRYPCCCLGDDFLVISYVQISEISIILLLCLMDTCLLLQGNFSEPILWFNAFLYFSSFCPLPILFSVRRLSATTKYDESLHFMVIGLRHGYSRIVNY